MNRTPEHTADETHRDARLLSTAPVVRAAVVIGTAVALIAAVGAPFKWY